MRVCEVVRRLFIFSFSIFFSRFIVVVIKYEFYSLGLGGVGVFYFSCLIFYFYFGDRYRGFAGSRF